MNELKRLEFGMLLDMDYYAPVEKEPGFKPYPHSSDPDYYDKWTQEQRLKLGYVKPTPPKRKEDYQGQLDQLRSHIKLLQSMVFSLDKNVPLTPKIL